MPISTPAAPTPLVEGVANATTIVSGSFTPTANCLLIAVANYRDDSAGGGCTFDGFSDSQSWGTWNTSISNTEYGSHFASVMIGYCVVGASPAAGTVTVTFSGSPLPDRGRLMLLEIDSGFDSTTPVLQSKTTGSASTLSSLTDDFSSAPATGSMLVSACVGIDSFPRTLTADTGWTEVEESVSNQINSNTQYRTGTTSTQYGASWADTNARGIAIAAIEIQEPSGGASTPGIELFRTIPGVTH